MRALADTPLDCTCSCKVTHHDTRHDDIERHFVNCQCHRSYVVDQGHRQLPDVASGDGAGARAAASLPGSQEQLQKSLVCRYISGALRARNESVQCVVDV